MAATLREMIIAGKFDRLIRDYALSLSIPPSDIDDVCQYVKIKIWRLAEPVRFVAMRRRVIEYARVHGPRTRYGTRRRILEYYDQENPSHRDAAMVYPIEDYLDRCEARDAARQRLRVVCGAVAGLTLGERECLLRSPQHRTRNSIYTHRKRARQKLRQALRDAGLVEHQPE